MTYLYLFELAKTISSNKYAFCENRVDSIFPLQILRYCDKIN